MHYNARSKSELLEIRRHRLVLVCFARRALAPLPIVLADAPPSALPAPAPSPIVLADAPPSALCMSCTFSLSDCARRFPTLRTPCTGSFSDCVHLAPACPLVLASLSRCFPPHSTSLQPRILSKKENDGSWTVVQRQRCSTFWGWSPRLTPAPRTPR